MKGFRLARLLRLRERQADALRLEWAQAARAASDAEAIVDASKQSIRDGDATVRDALGTSDAARTLALYARTDHLRALAREAAQLSDQARATADGARQPYETRRADARALARLEERWKAARRRCLRRAERRAIEEHLASKHGRGAPPADADWLTGGDRDEVLKRNAESTDERAGEIR